MHTLPIQLITSSILPGNENGYYNIKKNLNGLSCLYVVVGHYEKQTKWPI